MNGRISMAKLGASAVVAIALGLIIFGFASAETGDADVRFSDAAIERVTPKPATLVLRQSQVGIDLAPGYEGLLVIDRIKLPPDQLATDDAQNTVYFTPRPGTEIEEFAPGPHTIMACYWKIADRDRVDNNCDRASTFTWSFKVS